MTTKYIVTVTEMTVVEREFDTLEEATAYQRSIYKLRTEYQKDTVLRDKYLDVEDDIKTKTF